MPYLYSIKITTDAQDDVNQKFREHKLKGEVIVDETGMVFICPQISNTKWIIDPVSIQQTKEIDKQWDQVIESTLQHMESHYSVSIVKREPAWLQIGQVFRCPKMVQHIKNQDLLTC